MKKLIYKSNSAPSSKTSSNTSLNSLEEENLEDASTFLSEHLPITNEINDLQDIEANCPTNTGDTPNYYKAFTIQHPLGNLFCIFT